MKIEGLVAARERDSRYFIWSSTDTEQHISVGTDVTVEWDDRSEMTLTEIAELWRGRRGECLLEDISHCPFCGEKLP